MKSGLTWLGLFEVVVQCSMTCERAISRLLDLRPGSRIRHLPGTRPDSAVLRVFEGREKEAVSVNDLGHPRAQ